MSKPEIREAFEDRRRGSGFLNHMHWVEINKGYSRNQDSTHAFLNSWIDSVNIAYDEFLKGYTAHQQKANAEIEKLELNLNAEREKKDQFFKHSEKLEERIKELEQQKIHLIEDIVMHQQEGMGNSEILFYVIRRLEAKA